MLRIVGGELGSRRIDVPRGRSTRPTSDRVREAVFSMLGDITGSRVLDLFAGSGALGLESISRGARSAVFVDGARAATDCIARNIESLGVGGACEVIRGDWVQATGLMRTRGESFDLVFVDPPYAMSERVAADLAGELGGCLSERATLVFESAAGAPPVSGMPLERERRYGDTVVRLHVPS